MAIKKIAKPLKKASKAKIVSKPKVAEKSTKKTTVKAVVAKPSSSKTKASPKKSVKSVSKPAVKKPSLKTTAKPKAKPVAKKPVAKSVAKTLSKKSVQKPIVKPAVKVQAKKSAPSKVKPVAKEITKKATSKKVEKKTVKKEITKSVAKPPVKKEVQKTQIKAVKKSEIKPVVKPVSSKPAAQKPKKVAIKQTQTEKPVEPTKVVSKPSVRYPDNELEIFRLRIIELKKEAMEELGMLRDRLDDLNSYDFAEESMIYSMHMAEQGSEAMEKEKTYAQIQRINEYLKKLDEALERIKQKTYGVCRVCNCLIAKERLMAVPITTLSASYKIHKRCPDDGIDRIEPLKR